MKASVHEIAGLVSSQAAEIVKVGERFSKEKYFIDYARRWADPSTVRLGSCMRGNSPLMLWGTVDIHLSSFIVNFNA